MAGAVDVLRRCYTGILRGDVLWLEPRLPKPLRHLRLFVRYRGQSLAIELESDTVSVNAMYCVAPSVRGAVDGEVHHVGASQTRRFRLK